MNDIKNFCSRIGFPDEATEYLCSLIEKIGADTFDEAITTYVSAETDDYKPLTKEIADANIETDLISPKLLPDYTKKRNV